MNQNVYLQDVMATSLDLAGVEKPTYVQFNSLMDIIEGKDPDGHYDVIYGAYMDLQRMVRKDDFKLIVYPKIQKVLLYDQKADPYEINDLAGTPTYKEKIRQLFEELIQLQSDMGDTLDLKQIYNRLAAQDSAMS